VLNPCQSCTKRGLDDDERLVGRYLCGGPSKASTSSAIARPDRRRPPLWKPVAAPRTGVWEAKRSKELSEVGERGQIPGKPSQLGLKGVGIEVLQPVSTLFDRTQGSG
jgi:hypothetical protein